MSRLALWMPALFLLTTVASAVDKKDLPYAEAEIVRGEQVSEIKVFVVNPRTTRFEFDTGGAGGEVPEGEIAGRMHGITVIPNLFFKLPGNQEQFLDGPTIKFQAPVFGRRWLSRKAPKPERFVIEPGKRRLYYVFKVPSDYVRGDFAWGYLSKGPLRRGYEPIPKENAIYEEPGSGFGPQYVEAIAITKLIESSDKATKPRDK
jgi:hypothetical protein